MRLAGSRQVRDGYALSGGVARGGDAVLAR